MYILTGKTNIYYIGLEIPDIHNILDNKRLYTPHDQYFLKSSWLILTK